MKKYTAQEARAIEAAYSAITYASGVTTSGAYQLSQARKLLTTEARRHYYGARFSARAAGIALAPGYVATNTQGLLVKWYVEATAHRTGERPAPYDLWLTVRPEAHLMAQVELAVSRSSANIDMSVLMSGVAAFDTESARFLSNV